MNGTNPARSGAARRSRRGRLFLACLLALVIGGLASLAATTGWEESLAHLRRLTPAQVAALLGLSLVNYLFRGLRWHLFARRLALPTTLAQNLRHFVGGFAMSVTPGRVGELVRLRWIRRETGWRIERAAPLALVDRASDLLAMALVLAVAAGLSAAGIAGAVPAIAAALAVAWLATRPGFLFGLATLAHRATGVAARLFARIRAAARSLALVSDARVLSAAAVLGMIGWLAEGVAFHLLLGWMGSDIGLWRATAIFVFATLAGGLTGAPGGLGGAEGAMILLLQIEGVPLHVSVPATVVIRAATLWFAVALGFLAFPLAERLSGRRAGAG